MPTSPFKNACQRDILIVLEKRKALPGTTGMYQKNNVSQEGNCQEFVYIKLKPYYEVESITYIFCFFLLSKENETISDCLSLFRSHRSFLPLPCVVYTAGARVTVLYCGAFMPFSSARSLASSLSPRIGVSKLFHSRNLLLRDILYRLYL